MRKLFLILSIGVSIFQNTSAQTVPVTDTLAYLRILEARKAAFIGQPFSKLLDSLKINIIEFAPIASNPSDIKHEPSTFFSFICAITKEDYNYPSIQIYWRSYIHVDQSLIEARKTSSLGKWTVEAKQYYQDFIVEDIYVHGTSRRLIPN